MNQNEMVYVLSQILDGLTGGSITEPEGIAKANSVRASALRELVFNDACDIALETAGKAIVKKAEEIVRLAKRKMGSATA